LKGIEGEIKRGCLLGDIKQNSIGFGPFLGCGEFLWPVLSTEGKEIPAAP
jgi:hypothetical protein